MNVKEDEKDGVMIAWRDTSIAATKRREEIKEQEAAEARSGASEDKLLKKMSKRAQEETAEKARILEARRAAQAPKDSASPLAEEKSSELPEGEKSEQSLKDDKKDDTASGEEKKADTTPGEEAKNEEAPPAKFSFSLKTKVQLPKPGVGQMKSQSIFKRQRAENGEAKPKKRLKL